ncbi:Acetyltransferase (GNAT) domain-containing protein [Chryseobacterium piscicola]|jgi:GNAT superfamily N-acetyltransferase|uniref:Acetyltransferase (GNAT) domain-containing protein n=2 Tax=Chryseobacterium piscicola TaxID=551459 RepID=A0A1N7KT87_9FLAO|nr:GNAT family N-acetyltransferase [Chryseobacterium piscicola]SIS64706.1 Acetyltransferase (GNAT) domain-containing protein [Chryseobacterium piscicola]
MDLSDFTFSSMNEDDDLSDFDCDDEEMNEFFKEDSKKFQSEKITNTYLFKEGNRIVAFFSISNDCLNDLGYENNIWNKLHRKIKLPNEKRIRQYPAVKITRLGIDKEYQGKGLSHQLLDFIKGWTFIQHKPACRLLILDAYNHPKQTEMYQKNDFTFLLNSDENDKHRFMYFDLMRLE